MSVSVNIGSKNEKRKYIIVMFFSIEKKTKIMNSRLHATTQRCRYPVAKCKYPVAGCQATEWLKNIFGRVKTHCFLVGLNIFVTQQNMHPPHIRFGPDIFPIFDETRNQTTSEQTPHMALTWPDTIYKKEGAHTIFLVPCIFQWTQSLQNTWTWTISTMIHNWHDNLRVAKAQNAKRKGHWGHTGSPTKTKYEPIPEVL